MLRSIGIMLLVEILMGIAEFSLFISVHTSDWSGKLMASLCEREDA